MGAGPAHGAHAVADPVNVASRSAPPLVWQGNSAPAPVGDWRRHGLAGVGITWPAAKPRHRLQRSGNVLAAIIEWLRMPHSDYRSRFASADSALLVDDTAIRRPHPAGDAATDQGQRRSFLDAHVTLTAASAAPPRPSEPVRKVCGTGKKRSVDRCRSSNVIGDRGPLPLGPGVEISVASGPTKDRTPCE